MANPPVAYVAAWIRGYSGASKRQVESWLAVVERDGYEGPLPDGVRLAFGANLARAALLFDDVGRSVTRAAARHQLAGLVITVLVDGAVGTVTASTCAERRPGCDRDWRSWSGRCRRPRSRWRSSSRWPCSPCSPATRTADRAAIALAHRAAGVPRRRARPRPLCGFAYVALGRALARRGELAEADEQLGRALEILGIDGLAAQRRAHALLLRARAPGVVATSRGQGTGRGGPRADRRVRRPGRAGLLKQAERPSSRRPPTARRGRAHHRAGAGGAAAARRRLSNREIGCRYACRSTPSGPTSRRSTASSASPPGPRRSTWPASSALLGSARPGTVRLRARWTSRLGADAPARPPLPAAARPGRCGWPAT